MHWLLSYFLIAIVLIIVSKMEKHGGVAVIAAIVALAFSLLTVKIWGLLILLLIKLVAFLAYHAKAIIIKKLSLILLGIFSTLFTPVAPFIPIIAWGLIAYLMWHFFMDFYRGIFEWLQEKLCNIRDKFDDWYESAWPYGEGWNPFFVLPLLLLEFSIISGAAMLALWSELRSIAIASGGPTFIQTSFAFIFCLTVGLQLFFSYRSDTEIINRLRGDGIDHGFITIFGNFDDLID